MLMAEIRYHLDEHMDAAIAVGLRRRGIDVTTTVEANLLRARDPEQIAFATAQGRVFVTRERRIAAEVTSGVARAGIIVARSGHRNIGPTVLALT
jgi:uncharacterized protein with PIN domain